jgi:hypothetical protein
MVIVELTLQKQTDLSGGGRCKRKIFVHAFPFPGYEMRPCLSRLD